MDATDHHRRESAEHRRLEEEARREANWKRWGPYLAERQWGTVREDYSAHGNAWAYFPHRHSHLRAYRWGEDGLLGITDRECRLCFALALWNGRDPILKERLFGVSNQQGNHGEDPKETYYYLDSTPTHSYFKASYLYPHAEYPYEWLVEESKRRSQDEPEPELHDTGIFEEGRYFEVVAEYAKAGPNDICMRFRLTNRGPDAAVLHFLPTLWFRNSWIWGCRHEGCSMKPVARRTGPGELLTSHEKLEDFRFSLGAGPSGEDPVLLFTENETNTRALYGVDSYTEYVKDAFNRYVVQGEEDAVSPDDWGTKVAGYYRLDLAGGADVEIRARLTIAEEAEDDPLGRGFDGTLTARLEEADAYYDAVLPGHLDGEQRVLGRQSYAGLLWTKQFYHLVINDWLAGDPNMPPPPRRREEAKNSEWIHLYNRDVISMPDKWEYPWYAAWDLAFHMVPFAEIDLTYAKQQLILFLREWYMHPNGQLPAYEWAFSDVNPPVHAWACWRVYQATGRPGERDRCFLASAFQKLLLNFTWWVNRKDLSGKHIFSGGFLGLDNVGIFDRSRPLPTGGVLEQADATAWMAFYCTTMLAMAMELAQTDPEYEDMASKFFEHFVAIADAMNSLGGTGLWHEEDGFYYDHIQLENGQDVPVRVRSTVGLMPLVASLAMPIEHIDRLPGFRKRMDWFLKYRRDLRQQISYLTESHERPGEDVGDPVPYRMLAIPSRERLERIVRYLLDENEFLSPYGIRSLSKVHENEPYQLYTPSGEFQVEYEPGESHTRMFGGNSNWRGPVWFPINYLIIEALRRYDLFYGETLKVECPTGSGNRLTFGEVADEIQRRLVRLFEPGEDGVRPYERGAAFLGHGPERPHLFYEYFHGDTGRGCGASHQTGWTALVATCLRELGPS
ncbi:MAG: glucosidase [Armatimonadia bacterium]|nr:glucosidase [Armatimonadia bacterium]